MNELNPMPERQSTGLFQLLVEQVKDYAIFALNPEGIILSWNEGARRIKGYEATEIIGKHFSIFYPQQDKDNAKPQFELAKALELGRYEEEGWRLRKDRSRFWANVVITPLRDRNENLVGFAKVTRDLTQQKLQEETLQDLLQSEERFRHLVDQVKDYAIFILDAKGNISSWNQGAKRLKGYTADEILGQHFSIFYTPEDLERDHPTKELARAIHDGRYEEEGWRVRKDGSRFWASVVITSIWDKRGNLKGFAKVTRDLTQRKKQEDALRQKNNELESFAHTLSHDLRAPLRSISSFSEILCEEADRISEQEKTTYAQKIFKSSRLLENLIKEVLKLSELSLAPCSEEQVSLEDVLAECLSLLESDIQKSNAQITVKKPLPHLHSNRTLLVQLFSNLINNALKFVPKERTPEVEIFAVKLNGHCEIHVKDNGVGIPEQLQESIFNVFDRGAASSDIAGSGVGLAVVKRVVERVRGEILVKSRPDEGSDFIVTMECKFLSPLGTSYS